MIQRRSNSAFCEALVCKTSATVQLQLEGKLKLVPVLAIDLDVYVRNNRAWISHRVGS